MAAPPQGCAAKFAGAWEWTGGATYDVTFRPDGRIACPTCSGMTWTCRGDTFTWILDGQKVAIMTLSRDGNTMTGINLFATSVPQFAVRKEIPRPKSSKPPGQAQKPGQKAPNPPKMVAGPFLEKHDCPAGSHLVQGERTYEDGRKVPVWSCFASPTNAP
jgi:hypothetical protein